MRRKFNVLRRDFPNFLRACPRVPQESQEITERLVGHFLQDDFKLFRRDVGLASRAAHSLEHGHRREVDVALLSRPSERTTNGSNPVPFSLIRKSRMLRLDGDDHMLINDSDYIPIADVPRYIPGRRIHRATAWRWSCCTALTWRLRMAIWLSVCLGDYQSSSAASQGCTLCRKRRGASRKRPASILPRLGHGGATVCRKSPIPFISPS